MAKRKEDPIPAWISSMTIEQLQELAESHDSGSIGKRRRELARERDAAIERMEEYMRERYNISRAINEKLSAKLEEAKVKP